MLSNIFATNVNKLQDPFFLFRKYIDNTPCLGVPTESSSESFPVKIWPVKPLPDEKSLNFPFPRCVST